MPQSRFQPPAEDAGGTFRQLADVLDAQTPLAHFGTGRAAVLQLQAGEFRKISPSSAGMTVVIPAASAQNFGQRITVYVDRALGNVVVRAAAGMVNGVTSQTYGSGTYFFVLLSDGVSGWSTPPLLPAPADAGIGVLFGLRQAVPAGVAGAADDVTLYSTAAPFMFRIVDVLWLDSTAIALSTVQLRTATGGGGTALSSALTAAVTGTARNNDTATKTVALGGSVFLRRSDRGVAGEIIIVGVRE